MVFFYVGYYILVYLKDYFLHCVNTRQQEMLCHSLFLSGKTKFLYNPRLRWLKAIRSSLFSAACTHMWFRFFMWCFKHGPCANMELSLLFAFSKSKSSYWFSVPTPLRSRYGLGPAVSQRRQCYGAAHRGGGLWSPAGPDHWDDPHSRAQPCLPAADTVLIF